MDASERVAAVALGHTEVIMRGHGASIRSGELITISVALDGMFVYENNL